MIHVTVQPTQREAHQLPASRGASALGPLAAGCLARQDRFSRVMAMFSKDELNSFLDQLTADPRCSEEALCQLKEADDRADTGRPPPRAEIPPSREELFTFRVQWVYGALGRIHARLACTSRGHANKVSLELRW